MIVSDSSPLVSLSHIDMLMLINQMYGNVIIPQAVWDEVVVNGAGEPGAKEVESADWIHCKRVKNKNLVKALQQELDCGEAEAIALAIEENVKFVLMDERIGREVASNMGVSCVGLLGVLRNAKIQGLISDVKLILDKLQKEAGYRISSDLYHMILKDVGEYE